MSVFLIRKYCSEIVYFEMAQFFFRAYENMRMCKAAWRCCLAAAIFSNFSLLIFSRAFRNSIKNM